MSLLRPKGRAEAVYARFLDGERVWLAVRGADSLVLRAPSGEDVAVPSEPGRDGEHPVAVARFAVAEVFAGSDVDDLEAALLSVEGGRTVPVRHAATRRRGPMLPAPTSLDGRWQYTVGNEHGKVVIHRKAVDPSVQVVGFAAHPDGAVVRLATTETKALLVQEDDVVAEMPITDGELHVTSMPGLELGCTAVLQVGGQPATRQRNMVGNPQFGSVFPPLPGDLELRWVEGARLGVHHRSETP